MNISEVITLPNVETITIEGVEFRVFRKLPILIAREVQTLMIEAAEDYEGTINELETGEVKAKEAKNIKLAPIFEMQDLLLTKAVLSPKITKENIDDINHELQCCFQELIDYLSEKYTNEKKKVKKKSMNSPH